MSGGTGFPQTRPLLPNGEFAQPWRMFFQTIYQVTGGQTGQVFASSITVVPTGGITVADVQAALGQLDTLKVPKTTTVNGHALSANVTVTASDVGAPSGSGTSTGTNTGDQTITLTGDVTGSGTGSFAATVSKIGGKSVSLAGNLTTSGAFASTFTMTGVTSVTFPTSGTLATVSGNLGTPTVLTLTNATGLPLTTGVTGTLPAGNGGTGITGFAWSTYTPTATAGSGAFTTLGTLTGRYFTIGKLVFFSASIPITTNGTAAGYVQVSLPSPLTVGGADYYGAGRGNVSGKGLNVRMVTAQQFAEVRNYDGTYPGASGETLEISGTYELA